jgi:hypothetical protein
MLVLPVILPFFLVAALTHSPIERIRTSFYSDFESLGRENLADF